MSKELVSHHEIEQLIDHIPEELQAYSHFVVWKPIQINGRVTKPPFNPHTGAFADSTEPTTWGTFPQALRAYQTGHYAGIGFVFSQDDPFTGCDLDHCVGKGGTIEPWAMDIVRQQNSYTEYSPSTDFEEGVGGLHIITKAYVPTGRRKENTEVYASDRYFTLTGNHLAGTPDAILARQEAVEALYLSLEPPKIIEIYTGASQRMLPVREDDAALKKAMEAKNGEKFLRLWQGSTAGYPTKSHADMGLVSLLLYWTNDDIPQTIRLFRQSGLYDEKTDSLRGDETYLMKTIKKVIANR